MVAKLNANVRMLIAAIPPLWLYGIVATVAASYAALAAIGAATYRAALIRAPNPLNPNNSMKPTFKALIAGCLLTALIPLRRSHSRPTPQSPRTTLRRPPRPRSTRSVQAHPPPPPLPRLPPQRSPPRPLQRPGRAEHPPRRRARARSPLDHPKRLQ